MQNSYEQKSAEISYRTLVDKKTPKKNLSINVFKAFLSGGVICAIGQLIQSFFTNTMSFSKADSGNMTVSILMLTSILLTGFGVYDKLSQWCGAGTAVPVTGFANTMAACAIEHRTEGYVLGVGANMFKISGPVIVYGVFSAFIVAIIKILLDKIGVI
jgi:stage V sporulation protein AC